MAGLMSRYGTVSAGLLAIVAVAPYVWHARRRQRGTRRIRPLPSQITQWSWRATNDQIDEIAANHEHAA
jgi:hypothetical protein